MSYIDFILLSWLLALTVWMFYFKRGPQGERGEQGMRQYGVYSHEIIEPLKELIGNDAELLSLLVNKINSLQVKPGSKVGE